MSYDDVYLNHLTNEVIDCDDMQERIDELQNRTEEYLDENNKIELKQLLELKKDIGESNWENNSTLINEDHTEEYFKEEAKGVGNCGDNYSFNSCVNWEEWAGMRKEECEEIEYCDKTFYLN